MLVINLFMSAFLFIFMCTYCTCTGNTKTFGSAPLSLFCVFCRVTLWPHGCLSQLVHPPPQSLRSPLKLLLPKGAVCVKTHISPQQMVVSLAILSHQPDCLPGLGHLYSQPSRPLASHHPADKILFMD